VSLSGRWKGIVSKGGPRLPRGSGIGGTDCERAGKGDAGRLDILAAAKAGDITLINTGEVYRDSVVGGQH